MNRVAAALHSKIQGCLNSVSNVSILRSILTGLIYVQQYYWQNPKKGGGTRLLVSKHQNSVFLAVKSVKIVKWDKSPNTCYVIFYIFIFLELILRFVHLNYETRNFSFIL